MIFSDISFPALVTCYTVVQPSSFRALPSLRHVILKTVVPPAFSVPGNLILARIIHHDLGFPAGPYAPEAGGSWICQPWLPSGAAPLVTLMIRP